MKRILPERKTIIIVTGGPGTGKSGTVSRLISYLNDREIIRISYDEIKEKNWDRFGFENANQKEQLNAWSLEELYLTLRKYMYGGRTIITEYPYNQSHKPQLKKLIDRYGYFAVTIYLYAERETVYKRAMMRDRSKTRHPGHFLDSYHKDDPELGEKLILYQEPDFENFFNNINGKDYNICLGTDISVDVTDFSSVHYSEIIDKIIYSEKQM